jgi:hypothetical protein
MIVETYLSIRIVESLGKKKKKEKKKKKRKRKRKNLKRCFALIVVVSFPAGQEAPRLDEGDLNQ